MKEYSVREARKNFKEMLDACTHGEVVHVTRGDNVYTMKLKACTREDTSDVGVHRVIKTKEDAIDVVMKGRGEELLNKVKRSRIAGSIDERVMAETLKE